MSLEERLRIRGLSAYLELTKPGITIFVAVTAAVGYVIAALPTGVSATRLFHVVLGTTLTTAGALALNQYLERRPRRAHGQDPPATGSFRTASPGSARAGSAGRCCSPGSATSGSGPDCCRPWWPRSPRLLYNGAYTPLKSRSPLATPVGAVPGALPALIGWTAHTAGDPRGLLLFGILFLWQLVHVLALGWNLREDYVRAGFQLIPPGPSRLVAGLMVGYSVALLPVSLLPAFFGMTGTVYLVAAAVLGTAMAGATTAFLLRPTRRRCHRVFLGSILYHPALMTSMVVGAI